ncbi:ArsR/SmtB family transcription factor [Bacillus marinisedimentorum]|uniref:ArsR/SmtB family transcription factor n=1 Tax=Bacillus marinisedimentorum TaxID=1821260 RepID=UPI00087243C1|nr:metalloregulator ArsR/SmtB family transcription factor [Bacillus marinisedimentorum]
MENVDLPTELSEEIVSEVSQIFKALGDPTRLKILYLLAQQEVSVNEISERLDLKQSTVSHQLRLLKSLRLVKYRRAGTTLYYSCDDSHVMNTLIETIEHTLHH